MIGMSVTDRVRQLTGADYKQQREATQKRYSSRMSELYGDSNSVSTGAASARTGSMSTRRKMLLAKKLGLDRSGEAQAAYTGGISAYGADTGGQTANTGAQAFNANADENNLGALDVATQLPKLSTGQISNIISKYFSKSPVISTADAEGIYNAQQKSGMSALAILGIGALESGYGTSNIAKQKNNLWGWNATNVNPGGNATTFSQMSQGAQEFADKFMKTYYNGYGAHSINSAGTGNNPAGKGYAYYDNGTINSEWATSINSIMKNFYRTAKGE